MGAKRVNAYRQAVDAPELARVDAFEMLDSPAVGLRRYLAIPVRLDGTPLATRRPAPRFGEHTDEALREWLGLPSEELAALRRDRIIQDVPAGASKSGIAR